MVTRQQTSKVIDILKKHLKTYKRTTLNRESKDYTAFQILISCILSLRSRDETTEKVSAKLFKKAKTPEQILTLSNKELEKLVFSSGYYRNKAKVIKAISKEIIEKHKGRVPKKESLLLDLPGVGRKTSNIVLCLAYDQAVIPIDTHCHRIPNRIGWIHTKTPEQTEQELLKIIPKKHWKDFNEIFVLFGRNICLPISPWCSKCPIRKHCKRIGVTKSR